MKKMIFAGMILSSFYTCTVQANTDVDSAQVSLVGTLIDTSSLCTLSLTKSTLDLADYKIDAMPAQGEKIAPISAHSVGMVLEGTDCYTRGIRFIGTTDAAGNALVNDLHSDSAAGGVGVGLYQENGEAININTYVKSNLEIALGPYPLFLGLVKLNGQQQTAGKVSSSLTVELNQL